MPTSVSPIFSQAIKIGILGGSLSHKVGWILRVIGEAFINRGYERRSSFTLAEKYPVEVQDYCRKITNHLRIIYRIFPKLIKENRWMSTCNQPVGLANTRISTSNAQKSPQSLIPSQFVSQGLESQVRYTALKPT